jgi:hypothetical protein
MKKKAEKQTKGISSETNKDNFSNKRNIEIYTVWGSGGYSNSCVYIVDIDSETTVSEIIDIVDSIVEESKHEIVFIEISPMDFKFSRDEIELFKDSFIYVC